MEQYEPSLDELALLDVRDMRGGCGRLSPTDEWRADSTSGTTGTVVTGVAPSLLDFTGERSCRCGTFVAVTRVTPPTGTTRRGVVFATGGVGKPRALVGAT